MQALVWQGPSRMAMDEVPEPEAASGEVVVAVEAAGICGSELSGYLGENSLRRPPLVMGHEFVGRVVAVSPEGTDLSGRRVVVNPLLYCGACPQCTGGRANLCARREIIGAARPGAFAPRVAVPATSCATVPDGLPPAIAAMVEPLACSLRAVDAAAASGGGSLLIIGAGAIGLFALAAARRQNPGLIAVADTNAERLSAASAWGASAVLDARADLPAACRELTAGVGVDAVIDAVGLTATRRAAIRAVRPGGTVVCIGLHETDSDLPVNEIVRGEIRLIGSFCYSPADFARALELVATGLLAPGDWLEERPLAAGAGAFAELVSRPVAASKIVLRP